MFETDEFLCGLALALVLGVIIGICAKSGVTESTIDNTCQGTSWVIEEPLIKKTLTCVVEIKENK